jgi:Bacterial Ig-like domain (group 2)
VLRTSLWRGCWITLLFWPSAVPAQDRPPVSISLTAATMLVGETRPFRAVDDQGHAPHGVQWTISEPRLAELSSGDDVEITAKAAGSFTLTAHASAGFADARIEVVQASALPEGTIKWKVADRPGCHTIKITPAVPSAGGPDIFEESGCADGTYVQALTADGVLLWRRKMDSEPHSPGDRQVRTRHRPPLL